ncbi:MAG: hypothetical protein ABI741_07125 [Ferruginibacter sp.]
MKKSLMITAGIFYFTSLAMYGVAQTAVQAGNRIESSEPLTVRFLGSRGDWLVFRVEVKTGDIDHSTLQIDDAIEGELYSNPIHTNSRSQVMKIEKRDNQVLDFRLFSGKKVYTKTYTTDSNNKLFQKGIAVL